MVKTSSQLKNIVEDWIKTTNVKYKDTTKIMQEKSSILDWQFVAGEALHVTKIKDRDDRINIHMASQFTPEISSKLTVGADVVENMVNGLNAFAITNGLKIIWNVQKGLITGFAIKSYIDSDELDRPSFYHKWDRTINVSGHVQSNLIRFANPTQAQTTTEISDSTMYQ